MSAVMLRKNIAGDLQQLKDKKACFPLYDGYGITKIIICIIFHTIGRSRGVIGEGLSHPPLRTFTVF